jgi:hypothetical protein
VNARGFVALEGGLTLVRRGFESEVPGWLAIARGEVDAGRDLASRRTQATTASGGRGQTVAIELADGGWAFLRRYHHGGLLAPLLHDAYWQRPPRPWQELHATEAAREAGVVAPEVLAAAIFPLRKQPWLYRGVLVTRALEGRRSLGEALSAATTSAELERWIASAVETIRQLHRAGIHHPDLNVTNLLAGASPDVPVAVIDFDRASLGRRPVGSLGRWLARRRLARSIAKLGLPGVGSGAARRLVRDACRTARSAFEGVQ